MKRVFPAGWRFLALAAMLAAGCEQATAPSDTPAMPDAPLASARTFEIVVSWRDVADNETRYRVEFRSGDGPWLVLAETAANSGHVVHTNVVHGVTYYYRIQACNPAGCSAYAETSGKWEDGEAPEIADISVDQISARSAVLTAFGRSGGLPSRMSFFIFEKGNPAPVKWSDALVARPFSEGGTLVSASFQVFGLNPKTTYEFYAIIENAVSGRLSQRKPFDTMAETLPRFGEPRVIIFAGGPASLFLPVHSGGAYTEYYFEVAPAGSTFGQLSFWAAGAAAAAGGFQTATTYAWTLEPNTEYQWRVIARNVLGSVISETYAFRTEAN